MIVGVKRRHDDALRAEVESLRRDYDYHSAAAREPRRAAHAHRQRALHQRAATTRTAATCIPTTTRSGSERPRPRAGVRIFENSWVTKLDVAQRRQRRQRRAHRAGHGARAAPADRRQRAARPAGARSSRASSWPSAPTSRPREPLGEERARALITNNAAVADMNWVLDYFRRSADHRLLFGGRVSYSGVDPFDSARVLRSRIAQRVSAARRRAHRIRLGRVPRHHAESRAALRPARAERLFPAGPLRPRHGDLGHRGQARERSHRAAPPSASTCSRRFRTRDFPGGALSAPAGAGARDAVVPPPGPAVSRCAAFEFGLWFVGAARAAGRGHVHLAVVAAAAQRLHRRLAVEPDVVRRRRDLRARQRSARAAPRARAVAAGALGGAARRSTSPRATSAKARTIATRRSARATSRGFAWKSLYLVFWLQALLAWIISLPLLGAFASIRPLGVLD